MHAAALCQPRSLPLAGHWLSSGRPSAMGFSVTDRSRHKEYKMLSLTYLQAADNLEWSTKANRQAWLGDQPASRGLAWLGLQLSAISVTVGDRITWFLHYYRRYRVRWPGGVVVRALGFRLKGRGFDSRSRAFRQQPWASCSHSCASVTEQYNLVPVKGR